MPFSTKKQVCGLGGFANKNQSMNLTLVIIKLIVLHPNEQHNMEEKRHI
jgi:hypothetical protein